MKSITLAVALVALGVLGGTALYSSRQKASPPPAVEPTVDAAPRPTTEDAPPMQAAVAQPPPTPVAARPADRNQAPAPAPVSKEVKPDPATNATPFGQAIEVLVSPQASFQQRRAVWKRLRDAGELDQAITALKQGAASNPALPEYPAALGQAYINKIQTVHDFHDTSILGLQADQSFDAALKLDPSNWEAQFYKAASLAHWPAEFNKGPEVIQRLSTLIDQQEPLPPQPQFAQTYVLLGEQYQKAGQPDYAKQVWLLGATKFPGDATFQKKLASPASQ